MKYLCMIILFAMCITVVPEAAVAQKLSKKERKRLKKEQKKRLKELKKMSPENFQQRNERNEEAEARANELESELKTAKSDLSAKDAEVKQLQDKVRKMEEKVASASAKAPEPQQNVPMASNEDGQYDQGLVFRVQIGAYQNQSLAEFDTSVNFTEDNGPDNMQMYTLGNFRDYWEADKFKKYLRQMGVSDAWIIPYEDGQRRLIKEVLEQLRNSASLN